MRNLTIKRHKSFVACLAKLKVYIEDPDNSELEVGGVPCRKLGELKNGEEKTFSIGNLAARVFVFADKLSRNYSNDYYPIPAGTEDISLSGKCCYNTRAGHPFRFDGVTDEQVLANRKQGTKKGMLVLIVAAILGFGIGIVSNLQEEGPKTFTAEGMTITLTGEFEKESYEGFTVCYESYDVAVFVLEEPFTLMEGLEDYTKAEYGELVVWNNGLESSDLKEENGVLYFDYTAAGDDGENYYYCATIHKGPDAFWLIQFATMESQAEEYLPQILEWAASVTFE